MMINDVRVVMTVVMFVVFLGIVFWAYSKKRERAFDEAPFRMFPGVPQIDKREIAGYRQFHAGDCGLGYPSTWRRVEGDQPEF